MNKLPYTKDEIAVIAEITTYSGPWEDFFLMVVLKNGTHYTYPINGGAWTGILGELYDLLEEQLEVNSWDIGKIDSFVLWPKHMYGRKLYKFNEQKISSFKKYILYILGPSVEYTDEVKRLLY